MSDSSDISSLEEVESLASNDGEAQVSPIARPQYSHESASKPPPVASTPTRLSVLPSMDRKRPSAARLRRPVTAPVQGAIPDSFDRLKHLRIHMKQLQKLYDQEVHLEELAARDAFLQMMCTSSITLFRHCASRSRFYTAVKALMCQYLPAANAKLIQVERNNGKSYLVLQDNQSFEVADSDSIGIAGKTAHAMVAMNARKHVAVDLSASSSSNDSSAASIARTSDELVYSSSWLGALEDCVLPSANGHLFLVFPVHSIHRTGFHHGIDLLPKKKDVGEAQLLVVGLKNANGTPIGIIEAILSDASHCNVEFLDALGTLLATALESRTAMCRSTVEKVEVQVVDNEGEFAAREERCSGANGIVSSRQPMLTVPLVDNMGRIDAFGDAAVLRELDEDLLKAFQQPVSRICKANRALHGQTVTLENSLFGVLGLWEKLTAAAFETSECSKRELLRGHLVDFVNRMTAAAKGQETNEPRPQLRLLFRGETKEMYKRAYGNAPDSELDDSGASFLLGVDGQFSMLQRAMDSNEAFESGETVAVVPIRDRKDWGGDQELSSASQASASMLLILPSQKSSDTSGSHVSRTMKHCILPLVVQFMEHVVLTVKQLDRIQSVCTRVELLEEKEEAVAAQLDNEMILRGIVNQFLACKSLGELVGRANAMTSSNAALGTKLSQITVFVASFAANDEANASSSTTSFWTIAESGNACEKVELVGERQSDGKSADGIPSYILYTQEPLSYTSSHHAFTTSWRDLSLSRFEYNYFYAAPLNAGKSEPVAVLEFAFESEVQRDGFLANPRLKDSIIEVTSHCIELLQHFSEKERRVYRELELLEELHAQVLEKWVGFVANWSRLPAGDFETWKRGVPPLLLKLLPSCDFVNLLCANGVPTEEEAETINTILKDVVSPPHSSNTLNVMNQAILPTCMALPLMRKSDPSDPETVLGAIVFSKRSDEQFTSEEQQLGSLVSHLLSSRVVFFSEQRAMKASVTTIEKQMFKQSESLLQANEHNKCLLHASWRAQLLLQVSTLRYDKLVSSMSIEQLCQVVIQATRRVSTTFGNGVDEAMDGATACELSILLFDANENSFTLVTRHSSDSHRLCIRADDKGKEEGDDELWFRKDQVRVHSSPFTSLPPKLLEALGGSRQRDTMRSISVVPVVDANECAAAFFGLSVFVDGEGSETTNKDFQQSVAECVSTVCRLKREYEAWNARSCRLQESVIGLQTETRAMHLPNQVLSLAHELWVDALVSLSSFRGLDECNARIRRQFSESFIQVFRDHAKLTRVELAIGRCEQVQTNPEKSASLDSDAVFSPSSTESVFTKHFTAPGPDDTCVGTLRIAWNPEDTTLEEQKLIAHFTWISSVLQDLLSHCFSFAAAQDLICKKEAQCLALLDQAQKSAASVTRMEQEQQRWCLFHEVVKACADLPIPASESGYGANSPWCRLFAAIELFSNRHLKLWLVNDEDTSLWTITDGKPETRNPAIRKEKQPSSSVVPSSIELLHVQESRDGADQSSQLLGLLEVVESDMRVEGDMLVNELIAMVTTALRLKKHARTIQHLEQQVQYVAARSQAREFAWKEHTSSWSKRLLSVQSRMNRFVFDKIKSASALSRSEEWCSELLGLLERSLLCESKADKHDLRCSGPRMFQLRSFLSLEEDGNCGPSPIHSCNADCSQCSSANIAKLVDELGRYMDENHGAGTLALDLRTSASHDASSGDSDHPALSLMLSGCQAKHKRSWQPVDAENVRDHSTHQLIVKTFGPSTLSSRRARLVLIALVENSDVIEDANLDFALRLCGEFVLDALCKVQRSAVAEERASNLSHQLIGSEEALSRSERDRETVEEVVKKVGCGFQEAISLNDADSTVCRIIGNIFETMTGSPVKAHVCVRTERADAVEEWEVIGSESGAEDCQELLQSVASAIESRTPGEGELNCQQPSCTGASMESNGDTFRFFYRLSDASNAEIGVLVLDAKSNLSLLPVLGFANAVQCTRQFVSAAMGLLRQKQSFADQTRIVFEERDQLLLEKCQFELNSLEMKNLLHRNEVNLSMLRKYIDKVVHPTSELVDSFLLELEDFQTTNQVLVGVGNAVSSMEDVCGVQVNLLSKTSQSDPPLFTSIRSIEDKSAIRSDEVKEAIKVCTERTEMISVLVKGSGCKDQQRPIASTQNVKCVSIFPMSILQEAGPGGEFEQVEKATDTSREMKVLVVVLVDPPITSSMKSQPPVSVSSMYQIQQTKLLIRSAVVRCHTLVQGSLWEQQLARMGSKESNAAHQLALLEHKCDRLREKHDQHTHLYGGLANQMSLALSGLHPDSSRTMPSKHLLEMWQSVTEIIRSRLEGAFPECKTVRRCGVHLYGAVSEGNFFFFVAGSTQRFGGTHFQFIPRKQKSRDSVHQALREAFVSETIVESSQDDTARESQGIGSTTIYVPMMGLAGENQGHRRVVGILEVHSQESLDCERKETFQDFLTWFAPAVHSIGLMLSRKLRRKQASPQQQAGASNPSDPPNSSRQPIASGRLGAAPQLKVGQLDSVLPSSYSVPLLNRHAGSTVAQEISDSRHQRHSGNENVNGDCHGGDGDKSDNEDRIHREKREKLLPGIIALLLKMQETPDMRSLKKVVELEIKRLWSSHKTAAKMEILDCQLLSQDELTAEPSAHALPNNLASDIPAWIQETVLMHQVRERKGKALTRGLSILKGFHPTMRHQDGEQFWLVSISGTRRTTGERSTKDEYYLLIRGSYLDALFGADDERIYLPQIADFIQRHISQLCKAHAFQDQSTQLQETRQEASSLATKSHQLEQSVSEMSSFLVFVTALSGVETERALGNLVTEYFKKLLECDRVVFQLALPGSSPGSEPDRLLSHEHHCGHSIDVDEPVDMTATTLEMDNILRLRVFSPCHGGSDLLAVCVARMGVRSAPLDAQKQDLLRRTSPMIGSAMYRIRTEGQLSRQLHVNDSAQSEIGRLSAENKALHELRQHHSQAHDDFQLRLGNQTVLAAENKRLEAQISTLTTQLDACAHDNDEQRSDLSAREKEIAQLSFQLEQSARVEAQLRLVEEENYELHRREKKFEKKILKQRLQLKQLASEVGTLKQREEFDKHEVAQLQRQIAVLNEKQQTSGTVKASLVRSQPSRYYHHMQQQMQKRKQVNLAQELRHLAAMEVREMKVRNREQREKSRHLHNQGREGEACMKQSRRKNHSSVARQMSVDERSTRSDSQ